MALAEAVAILETLITMVTTTHIWEAQVLTEDLALKASSCCVTLRLLDAEMQIQDTLMRQLVRSRIKHLRK